MKAFLAIAGLVLALSTLTACMGDRGYIGDKPTCRNSNFLGVSLVELVSPCRK